MSAEYLVTIKLKSDFPRDVDMDGNPIWWNTQSIAEELQSWLEDLGFDLEASVKQVL